MRGGRIVLMVVLMLGCFGAGAWAATNVEKVEAFLRHDYKVYHDGRKAEFGPVLVYDNRSYLPLRKVGELVGADIIWKAEEQAIYVNSRFAGQPENPNVPEEDRQYEWIRLSYPINYLAHYRGGQFPVLANSTMEGLVYYRDKDIQRMGINTNGFVKFKERLTGDLYVLESDVNSAWNGEAYLSYSYNVVVPGERNQEKQEAIQSFIEFLPEYIQMEHRRDPEFPLAYPYIFAVDNKDSHNYDLLGQENGLFVKYELTLWQDAAGKWTYSQWRKVKLE